MPAETIILWNNRLCAPPLSGLTTARFATTATGRTIQSLIAELPVRFAGPPETSCP